MKFVPRFDALESIFCLSDVLSGSSSWISSPTTQQATIQTVTVPVATVDPSQPPIVLAGGANGTMPTTPGVHLDIYPPTVGPGLAPIPQVPVTPQDPNGLWAPDPFVPKLPVDPVPYYPPPYGVPSYVTLSNMPVSNVT